MGPARERQWRQVRDAYLQAGRAARDDCLRRHPEFAAELRALFDAEDHAVPTGAITRGDPTLPLPDGPPPSFGDYEILGELGHGGMGVVYRARQKSLNRFVALKLLPGRQFASAAQLRRFHVEAETAARLDHAHIVPIYEVGSVEGAHYFSMKLIEGPSLSQQLARSPRPTPADVARLVVTVARAVHHAHQRGVLHRDIKPGNILLASPAASAPGEGGARSSRLAPGADATGLAWCQPYVTDFGLAREITHESGLTQSGMILGTPGYLAPEQASGQRTLTTAADVYGLGAVLYEMLTGRPPFVGATPMEAVLEVLERDPAAPRSLAPGLDRDLETVCLRCLERAPERRYGSAAALADDLERWLTGVPIRARPAGRAERLAKWARRRPAVAALSGLLVVLAVTAAGLVTWKWLDAEQQRRLAEQRTGEVERALEAADQARGQAEAALYRSLLGEARALRLSRREGWRADALAGLARAAGIDSPERDRPVLRGEVVACLAEFDARLLGRVPCKASRVWSVAFSPDGQRIATAGYGGVLTVWRVQVGGPVAEHSIRDDGPVHQKKMYYPEAPLPAVRFLDAQRLAFTTWKQSVVVAPVRAGAPERTVEGKAQPRCLAADRRGKWLAVSWIDGRVVLYDRAGGQEVRSWPALGRFGSFQWVPVALTPDGARIAFIGPDGMIQVRLTSGEGEPVVLGRHRDGVRSLTFSGDGRFLLSASQDRTARVWDASGRSDPITLLGHTNRVNGADFSPDGEQVATVSDDQSVRLWDRRTGQALMVLRPGGGSLLGVAFSPDGRRLAVTSDDLFLYEVGAPRERRHLAGHEYYVNGLCFLPGRPRLASCSGDKSVIVWDLESGQLLRRWRSNSGKGVHNVAASPDGRRLTAGHVSFYNFVSHDDGIRVWDAESGAEVQHFTGHRGDVPTVAFYPTGEHILSVGADGTGILWNVASGAVQRRWSDFQGTLPRHTFLRDGTLLLSATRKEWLLRNLEDDRGPRRVGVPGQIAAFAVSRDGRRALAATADGRLRAFSLPDLAPGRTVQDGQTSALRCVTWSADGSLVATGGDTRTLVLRDGRTLVPLLVFPPQNGVIRHVAFDDTGRWLATGGVEEQVTLWDLRRVRAGLARVGLDWR
jgi:WD40 repeat protein